MRKQSIKQRRKAGLGAAVLAGAGIGLLGNVISGLVSKNAAENQAREEAAIAKQNAKEQADAIKQQTASNVAMQNKAMQLTSELHKQQQDKQNQIQMNLAMLTGSQNFEDRKRASLQAVKYGGHAGNKFSLRGSDNVDFRVTDGGGVRFKGFTPEGFELYQFVGDTHNQTHTLPNGKKATGVGVDITTPNSNNRGHKKYGGNADIEAEGGEYALAVPGDLLFISKHNINGFNPSEAVKQGVNPLTAFETQEAIKHNMGKRKLRFLGGNSTMFQDNLLRQGEDNIMTDDAVVGVGAEVRKLKNGGCATPRRKKLVGGFSDVGGLYDVAGAGIGAVGSLLGSYLTTKGNKKAAGILTNAYNQAGDIMADAYSRMSGISMDTLNKDDYAAAHYLPALRNYQVSAAPKLNIINRSANRNIKAIKNRSLSSAAALNRMANIEDARISQLAQAYDIAEQESEKIKQANNAAINQAAEKNAALDMQAMADYNQAKRELLEYNNNIENQKIAGIAGARSGVLTQSAQVNASTAQANAQSWANTVSGIGNLAGNTLSGVASRMYNLRNTLLTADPESRINYYIQSGNRKGLISEKRNVEQQLVGATGRLKETLESRLAWIDAALG